MPRARSLLTFILAGTLVLGLVAAAAQADGGEAPKTRVLRDWEETIEVDGVEVWQRIEIVFDYERGEAFQRIYDRTGKLVGTRPSATPAPSPAEVVAAKELVRGDVELEARIRSKKLRLEGGFILREEAGKPCGPPSRCLQIFASNGETPSFRAVVDLVTNQVVYRDLDRWQVEED